MPTASNTSAVSLRAALTLELRYSAVVPHRIPIDLLVWVPEKARRYQRRYSVYKCGAVQVRCGARGCCGVRAREET